MSRILFIGNCPPRLIKNIKIEAAHYRSWQLLEPLLDDGHEICLCTDPLPADALIAIPESWAGKLSHTWVDFSKPGWIKKINGLYEMYNPDCIVAVNFEFGLYATRIKTHAPLWVDIFGDYLTIQQAYCYRAGSDRGLKTSIDFMYRVLQTGDIFSVCGTPQRHAMVGELAMAGRLNHRTFGYEFTRVILPGAAPSSNYSDRTHANEEILARNGIGKQDFIVLWCGGYNTWTDIDTLFNGLEWAITQNEHIHFVSIGASSYNAIDNAYDRFVRKVDESPHRSRYHMLGWQPWNEIPAYYSISNLGINIDTLHYETIYGTRTRLLEMMSAGLPVVTSLGSEVSYMLQTRGTALGFNPGDWQELGRQIIYLATNSQIIQNMRLAVNRTAQSEFSFYETTNSLREWVADPHFAPDNIEPLTRDRLKQGENLFRANIRKIIWKTLGLYR